MTIAQIFYLEHKAVEGLDDRTSTMLKQAQLSTCMEIVASHKNQNFFDEVR